MVGGLGTMRRIESHLPMPRYEDEMKYNQRKGSFG